MPPQPPSVTRRTTLAVASLGLLAGCEWGPDRPPAGPAPADDETAADGDAAHAATALAAITATAGLVAEVAAQHRRLAGPLADLTALHLAHADLLREAGQADAETVVPEVPTGPGRALAAVVRAERELGEDLAGLAELVASGPFARALASMSAGVAQHVAALPRQAPGAAA